MANKDVVLDALDQAFRVHVESLFRNLCDGYGGRDSNALTRFDAGMDTALRARTNARARFE